MFLMEGEIDAERASEILWNVIVNNINQTW